MAEEKSKKQEENPKKADIGDMIQLKRGDQKGKNGIVISLRENSAIVEIGKNPTTGEPIRTVVNHKNYKRVK
jgi:uncharacterized protein YkvS